MRGETEAAIAAAQIAQTITTSREGADAITPKVGIDLVTDTDVACEDAIRAELSRRFPDYPVIGEERGGQPVKGKSYWLVDPICGTRSFASNLPLYCTNIALVEDGVVTVAAVALGGSGEIVYAERGKGTRMYTTTGETPVRASDHSSMIWIDDGKSERAAATLRNALLSGRWYVCTVKCLRCVCGDGTNGRRSSLWGEFNCQCDRLSSLGGKLLHGGGSWGRRNGFEHWSRMEP